MSSIDVPRPSWRSRLLRYALIILYCLAILLAFDFLYSTFIFQKDPSARVADARYSHGLKPNFAGWDTWGPARYRLYTNSLGFRDFAVREIPAKPAGKRVILIGDSFAEALGIDFDESFAGLLYRAGQARNDKIEFLNAAVLSYSPVIYYRKIKYLLDAGVQFDEVVVFFDISDVQDEAIGYFCIDEHPEYRRYCDPAPVGAARKRLADYFVVTDSSLRLIRLRFYSLIGQDKRFLRKYPRAAWTIPGVDVGNRYAPLGVEGGIERSLKNMQTLADLLRARGIALSVVVYPWPTQLAHDDRESRQVKIWREFCAKNCKAFVDLFPALFAQKDAHPDWYQRLFIDGDFHFNAAGNRLIYEEVVKQLVPR